MIKKAVFPGSFDPLTLGHTDIIDRALPLFDEIIIAIGTNSSKEYMFTLDQRKGFIEETYKDQPKVIVDTYQGLTIDYCQKVKSEFILRGLRNPADFEFEKAIAQTNRKMSEIETVFFTDKCRYILYQFEYCTRYTVQQGRCFKTGSSGCWDTGQNAKVLILEVVFGQTFRKIFWVRS